MKYKDNYLYHINMQTYIVHQRNIPNNEREIKCNLDDLIKRQYYEMQHDTGDPCVIRDTRPYIRGNGIFPLPDLYNSVIHFRDLIFVGNPKPVPTHLTLFQCILKHDSMCEFEFKFEEKRKKRIIAVDAVDDFDRYLEFCEEFNSNDNAFNRLKFHPYTEFKNVIFTKLETIRIEDYELKVSARKEFLEKQLNSMSSEQFINKWKKQQTFVCNCGSTYDYKNKMKHLATKKHVEFIKLD